MSDELKLYKLCCTDDNEYEDYLVSEIGWINDEEFCVWVSWTYFEKFIKNLSDIFGEGIFDDGGFDANMQSNCVCIDLCEAIGHCIDIEETFPKDKYKH